MTELVPVDASAPAMVASSSTELQLPSSPLTNVELHLVDSIDELMKLKRWAGERRETPLGVDTETGGLSPWSDHLRLVQFGDLHHGWAVPWERWGGGALEILNSYDGEFVYHNSSFDLKYLNVRGGYEAPWHRVHDTMSLAALDDPLRPKGLKPLAARLVDPQATRGEKLLKDGMARQGWTWATVPETFAPYWVYAALDPVLTAHIFHHLYPRVQRDCPRAYDLEIATTRICAGMMMHGMRVDVPYVEERLAGLRTWAAETRTWLAAMYDVTSPMSAGQLGRAFTALGEEIVAFTPTGAPRMDKETLTFYQMSGRTQPARDLAMMVLKLRHAEKMCGSYLGNFLETRDADDLVHCQIWPSAARTGRMSISEPALQTLPRDDKIVRGSFVPRDGHVFISCDLDQVEMRMAAHLSGDEGLIRAFLDADETGVDFFTTIARQLFDDPQLAKGDPRRQITKNVGYAKLYGAGVPKMAATAGVPVSRIAPVNMLFDQRFPGLLELIDDTTNEAKETSPPSVRSELGRLFVFDKGRERTQATNARIQGGSAEYFKQRLVNLDAAGLGDYLVLPIHDEVLLEVPAAEAEEALATVRECMGDRETYRVPITADGKIMRERWQK